MFLKLPTRSLDLSSPIVMGILNITPDSMFDGGSYMQLEAAVTRTARMIEEGAAIIDIGGESTRPNALAISPAEELTRVLPVIKAIRQRFTIPLSIDTSQPLVMRAAIEHGVEMINDVRALRVPGALTAAAELKVPICLMHMSYPFGKTENTVDPLGDKPLLSLTKFFKQRIAACQHAGILREKLVLDPGFGAGNFGKTTRQNLQILKNIDELTCFKLPLLVGLSYKSFISDLLNIPLMERLPGVLAATALAVARGAAIIRSHDVAATRQVAKVVRAINIIDLAHG